MYNFLVCHRGPAVYHLGLIGKSELDEQVVQLVEQDHKAKGRVGPIVWARLSGAHGVRHGQQRSVIDSLLLQVRICQPCSAAKNCWDSFILNCRRRDLAENLLEPLYMTI